MVKLLTETYGGAVNDEEVRQKFESNFENSNRTYVHVSLDYEVTVSIPNNVPGLLINRESFLQDALKKTVSDEQLNQVIKNGNYDTIAIDTIDEVADECISKTRLITSGASFLTGLPSSLPALPVTVPVLLGKC